MSRSALAVLAMALLIWLGQWASVYAAAQVDLAVLPDHSRRRMLWQRHHARLIYLCCLVAIGAAAVLQMTGVD